MSILRPEQAGGRSAKHSVWTFSRQNSQTAHWALVEILSLQTKHRQCLFGVLKTIRWGWTELESSLVPGFGLYEGAPIETEEREGESGEGEIEEDEIEEGEIEEEEIGEDDESKCNDDAEPDGDDEGPTDK